jgi:hypothetical protein
MVQQDPNRETPVIGPSINKTELKISSDGYLVIINRDGNDSVIWSTSIANMMRTNKNTTSAVLLNTGNLAIRDNPSSDVLLWQSFDHPTDVILPEAKFGRNTVTGLNRMGISKKSLIDPGQGSYSC